MATIKQILIASDQLLNTLCGGWADETLSARVYRLRNNGTRLAYDIIDALFFWQDGHCEQSYMSELKRRQLPPEYRNGEGEKCSQH